MVVIQSCKPFGVEPANAPAHRLRTYTPGTALRIGADDLRSAMAASGSLQQHLSRFAHVLAIQAEQAALSNGCHRIEQRSARWLLMCHVRVDGDTLSATQMS